MTYVDDAFAKCKSALEVTKTETAFAAKKHQEIRDLVRSTWELDDDFLTGSYRRETKTKKLKGRRHLCRHSSRRPSGPLS